MTATMDILLETVHSSEIIERRLIVSFNVELMDGATSVVRKHEGSFPSLCFINP